MRQENPMSPVVALFSPKPGETAVVVCDAPREASRPDGTAGIQDRDRMEVAELAAAAFEEAGVAARVLTYAAVGRNNAPLPPGGLDAGGAAVDLPAELGRASMALAVTRYSATAPLRDAIERSGRRLRAVSMPGFRKRSLDSALKAPRTEIAALTRRYKESLDPAEYARVTFSTGHVAVFDLRGQTAHVDDGDASFPGALINCPFGETYSITKEGPDSGTAGEIPVALAGGTAVFTVRANAIVRVEGGGEGGRKLEKEFAEEPAAANIAEFGLGANRFARILPGDPYTLEEEKALGFHFARGLNAHFGGSVGPSHFRAPGAAVHQDIVYNADTPIGIRSLVLIMPDGTNEEIFRENRLVMRDTPGPALTDGR